MVRTSRKRKLRQQRKQQRALCSSVLPFSNQLAFLQKGGKVSGKHNVPLEAAVQQVRCKMGKSMEQLQLHVQLTSNAVNWYVHTEEKPSQGGLEQLLATWDIPTELQPDKNFKMVFLTKKPAAECAELEGTCYRDHGVVGQQREEGPPPPSNKERLLSDLTIPPVLLPEQDRGSTPTTSLVDRDTGHWICCRLSRREANKIPVKDWQEYSKAMEVEFKYKPKIKRGKKTTGTSSHYVMEGFRKDPKGLGVGPYAFTKNVPNNLKVATVQTLTSMVGRIEKLGQDNILKHLPDFCHMKELLQASNVPLLNMAGGYNTQLALACNYWSVVHIDGRDYYYCTVSCLPPIAMGKEGYGKVLYNFVFPEYDIAIPLVAGDILIFNPTVLHGCTNPVFAGSLIFSSYLSCKTVGAHLSAQDS